MLNNFLVCSRWANGRGSRIFLPIGTPTSPRKFTPCSINPPRILKMLLPPDFIHFPFRPKPPGTRGAYHVNVGVICTGGSWIQFTLFFIRMVTISFQPQIFLISILHFDYFQPILSYFYVLEMKVSVFCFIWNTYLYPLTNLSSFSKIIFMKSQPRWPCKIYSYKK